MVYPGVDRTLQLSERPSVGEYEHQMIVSTHELLRILGSRKWDSACQTLGELKYRVQFDLLLQKTRVEDLEAFARLHLLPLFGP